MTQPPDMSKQPQIPAPQPQQPPAYGAGPGQYAPQPSAGHQQGYAQQGYPMPGQYAPQAGYGQPSGVQPFSKPTGWLIVNWLFFWPLAIYSLTSAWGNIDRALFAGDMAGAQYQSDRVKKYEKSP